LHSKERVQPRLAAAQARAHNPDVAQRTKGVASLEAGPTCYGAGTQAQPELQAPAQLGRERRRPGRNWGKTGPLGIPPCAGPARERQDPPRTGPSQNWSESAQPGAVAHRPRRAASKPAQPGWPSAPEDWPSRDSPAAGPAGTGRDWPRNLIYWPKKAEFAACRPTNVNSGQEKIYSGRGSYMPARGMMKSTPGPCMSAGI
jgi:hypothetical protein